MDWSYLATANAFIDGISQNAWDTGAGTGIYLTFATYMKKDSKVVSYALITPILNNMISLMMGTDFRKSVWIIFRALSVQLLAVHQSI